MGAALSSMSQEAHNLFSRWKFGARSREHNTRAAQRKQELQLELEEVRNHRDEASRISRRAAKEQKENNARLGKKNRSSLSSTLYRSYVALPYYRDSRMELSSLGAWRGQFCMFLDTQTAPLWKVVGTFCGMRVYCSA